MIGRTYATMNRDGLVGTKDLYASVKQTLPRIPELGLLAPQHIYWGEKGFSELPAHLPKQGAVLLLTGRSAGLSKTAQHIRSLVRSKGLSLLEPEPVSGEPDTDLVDKLAAYVRTASPDLLIALGGGSVLDTAKAVAALGTNAGPVSDYLEGLGVERKLQHAPLPWLAIPTVAGTGAEVTKNAVVRSVAHQVKKSMRDDHMLARAVWLLPEATTGVPPEATAAGGLDTLTQLLESCITAKRQAATTAMAHEGLKFMRDALPTAYRHPQDIDARAALLWASLLSGVSLANAGLAMAHGIAAALGGRYGLAHGLACGLLLPHTLRYNREAAEKPLTKALALFLGEEPRADSLERGLSEIEHLTTHLGVPPDLRFLKLTPAQVRELAEASGGSSMSGNPIPMNPELTFAFLAPLCGV